MNQAFTPPTLAVCQNRSEQLREQEWQMAQRLLALASTLITRLRLQTDYASPSQIHTLLDLASRLGRLSCALPTDSLQLLPTHGSLPPEVQDALNRVYGSASKPAAPGVTANPTSPDSQSPLAESPSTLNPQPLNERK
jgi:hypothetical protein